MKNTPFVISKNRFVRITVYLVFDKTGSITDIEPIYTLWISKERTTAECTKDHRLLSVFPILIIMLHHRCRYLDPERDIIGQKGFINIPFKFSTKS